MCLLPGLALGQAATTVGSIGNSPLSQLGIGELLPEGSVRQQAMGEAGSASGSSESVNLLNPAMLYYSRQFNLESILRTGAKVARTDAGTLRSGRFTPLLVNMALPVARPLTLAIGLRQHSAIDYSVSNTGNAGGTDTYTNYFTGGGSLSQAYLGAGLRLAEGLTVGAQGTYWFGTMTRFSDVALNTDKITGLSTGEVTRQVSSRVSDVQIRLGTAYRRMIGKHRYALAVSGELPRIMSTSDVVIFRRYNGSSLTTQDTLVSEAPGTLKAPRTLRLGLAFEQPLKYSVVLDLVREYWKGVQPLGTTTPLYDSYRGGLGVEWMPNLNGQNYFSVVSYRAGIYGRQLPYELEGKRMSDMGFTLGMGFPILRKEARYTRPYINSNLSLGVRSGPTGSGSYRETYVNFTLGIVLNDAQWFVRYKID